MTSLNWPLQGEPDGLSDLAEWCDRYDPQSWNGDYYDIEGHHLTPIHDLDGSIIDWILY